MDSNISAISRALELKRHPLARRSGEIKAGYLMSLRYIRDLFAPGDLAAGQYLAQYERALLGPAKAGEPGADRGSGGVPALLDGPSGNRARRFCPPIVSTCLLADCFYLFAPDDAKKGRSILRRLRETPAFLGDRRPEAVFEAFYHGGRTAALEARPLRRYVDALRENARFVRAPAQRILVAATVSAGKSTLINALMGKPLARTAQEACTGYLHAYYNKRVEDHIIGLSADGEVVVGAEMEEVKARQKHASCDVAAYYKTVLPLKNRVCLLDTPGANSALDARHGEMAKKAIRDGAYNKMVYVFNAAGGLGREEELEYLRFIVKTVPGEKLIFVLNQLDAFRSEEDSVGESLAGVRDSLIQLGLAAPVVLPFSAYFACLLKRGMQNVEMSAGQRNDFERLSWKFDQPQYDLSGYYAEPEETRDDPLFRSSVKCGLYGLEKILWKG